MNRVFVLSTAGVRDRATACVGDLPILHSPLEVRIQPYRARRTLKANDRYHGILRVMADALGYTEREMAEVMKAELLEPTVVTIGDRQHLIYPSTAGYTSKQMSAYVDQILEWAALNGLPTREDTST